MSEAEQKYDQFERLMETHFPKMFSVPYGGFAIGEGWWSIIRKLCGQIQGHIDWKNENRLRMIKENPHAENIPEEVHQVVVHQIKEKFGGLRFYYDGGDQYIRGLVDMAETWADHSCEICGNRGIKRSGGWIQTLCDKHEEERKTRLKDEV